MLIPKLYTAEQISSKDVMVHYDRLHPIYAGHFPKQPITPGVCLIQTAIELMEKAKGSSLQLVGARQIKFLQMHTPDKPLRFECSWTDELRGRVAIYQDNSCIAKIDAQFELLK